MSTNVQLRGSAERLQKRNISEKVCQQYRIYKEEQLLSHPGGDYLNLKEADPLRPSKDRAGFWNNLVKDVKDTCDNAGNLLKVTHRFIFPVLERS